MMLGFIVAGCIWGYLFLAAMTIVGGIPEDEQWHTLNDDTQFALGFEAAFWPLTRIFRITMWLAFFVIKTFRATKNKIPKAIIHND